jgi:hypothetical protein
VVLRWRAISVEAAEQCLRCSSPDGGWILGHDRDPRLQKIREQDVVEAEQSNTLVKTQAPKCTERPDGDQVLCGEQGRGRSRLAEQLGHGGL